MNNAIEKLYRPLSDKTLNEINSTALSTIKSSENKEIFKILNSEYIKIKEFKISQHLTYFKQSCLFFINLIADIDCNDLSWEKYCELMHQISDLKSVNSRAIPFLRALVCEFFKIYINTIPKGQLENVDELKEYSYLLVSDERIVSEFNALQGKKIIDKKICTNFSMDSKPSEIYKYDFNEGKENYYAYTLINLNTSNSYIQQLLISFVKTLKPKEITSIQVRTFLFYFNNSLIGFENEVTTIQDINYLTFKKQYRFYSKLEAFYGFSKKHGLKNILISFYVFLLNYLTENEIEHQIFSGTLIDEQYITNVYFYNYYEAGYVRFNHSHLEDVPEEERWVVRSYNHRASARSQLFKTLDFTKVKDRDYRIQLKEYFWLQESQSFVSATSWSSVMIEFLNNKRDYDNKRKKAYSTEISKYVFSNEFLYHQISWLKQKYPDQESRRKVLGAIKQFLSYHRSSGTYEVNEILLEELSIKSKKDYTGNPIDSEDLKLIINEFKKEKDTSIVNELYYIIAVLAVSTKLRTGEIINLQRSCILKCDNNGGKVEYYSKTSGNEKVNIFLTLDKIRLIQRAIEITEDYINKAETGISNFIFLTEDFRYKNRIVRISSQFSVKFSQIIENLNSQIKGKYTAYDLRDTFIDTIYKEGIKENLHPLAMVEMVGNSPTIALKHYRKNTELIRYAEMFAGVTISNVDINGEILEEGVVRTKNPVLLKDDNQGLGACVQNTCTAEAIDEEYKCLICPFFATTVERLNMFRAKIEELKNRKIIAKHSEEKKLIETELKLYTAYYAKLLELRGK